MFESISYGNFSLGAKAVPSSAHIEFQWSEVGAAHEELGLCFFAAADQGKEREGGDEFAFRTHLAPFSHSVLSYTSLSVRPYLIKRPENASAFAGDSIRLTCVIGGRPRPEVRWSRRNGALPASRSYTHDDQSVLTVKDVRPEDQDEYICVAENRAGSVKASANVQVHCEYTQCLIQFSPEHAA